MIRASVCGENAICSGTVGKWAGSGRIRERWWNTRLRKYWRYKFGWVVFIQWLLDTVLHFFFRDQFQPNAPYFFGLWGTVAFCLASAYFFLRPLSDSGLMPQAAPLFLPPSIRPAVISSATLHHSRIHQGTQFHHSVQPPGPFFHPFHSTVFNHLVPTGTLVIHICSSLCRCFRGHDAPDQTTVSLQTSEHIHYRDQFDQSFTLATIVGRELRRRPDIITYRYSCP